MTLVKILPKHFFETYKTQLLSNRVLVIPSPYNYVKNAATILTEAFIGNLNHLLVNENGEHVEYSIIHRKVSYTKDYGFLSKEERSKLLSNDLFYLNREFCRDKLLVFIDDVNITGTHEEKIIDIIEQYGLDNDVVFVYLECLYLY